MEPQRASLIEDAARVFADGGAGRSVVVMTTDGTMIAAVRPDVRRPAASLMKVPIALAAYEAAARGELDLNARVRCCDLPPSEYPSVLALLDPEHELTLRELAGVVLSTSDNGAAEVLRREVGSARVNSLLAGLGCRDTVLEVGFTTGDILTLGRQNVTTASDMARVFCALASAARWSPVLRALENNVRNFRIPLRLPDELRVPHKTGSLEGVVSDVGILRGSADSLVLAVLTESEPDHALASIAIGDLALQIFAVMMPANDIAAVTT